MFHAALTWPLIRCCWPSTEASPFCALDTKRNDVVNTTIATRSSVYETGVRAKVT